MLFTFLDNEVCLANSNTHQICAIFNNFLNLEHHTISNITSETINGYINETINETINEIFSNDITEIAIFFGVLMFSVTLSTLFVSNYVYKIMINEFAKNYYSNQSLYDYDSYFYKYFDEYEVLENCELDTNYLNSLGNKYIKEITPCGDVILNYNNEYNSFDYYCTKSNTIGFNYLEVVSRIYVVNFNCKKIYNDNYDNLTLYYNIKYGITTKDESLKLSSLKSAQENSSPVFFSKKTQISKNTDLYNFISNRYKYKGRIEDFNNYCKTNCLTVCYSVSDSSSQDLSTCFFYLNNVNNVNNVNNDAIKSIDFKTFKTFKTT